MAFTNNDKLRHLEDNCGKVLQKTVRKFELPLCGHKMSQSQNPDVSQALLQFIEKLDSSLKSHFLKSIVLKGISKTT